MSSRGQLHPAWLHNPFSWGSAVPARAFRPCILLHCLSTAAQLPPVRADAVRTLSLLITPLPVVNHPSLLLQLPRYLCLVLISVLKSFPLPIFLCLVLKTLKVRVRVLWRQKANFSRDTSKGSFCSLGVMFANSTASLAWNWCCWNLHVCFWGSCDNSSLSSCSFSVFFTKKVLLYPPVRWFGSVTLPLYQDKLVLFQGAHGCGTRGCTSCSQPHKWGAGGQRQPCELWPAAASWAGLPVCVAAWWPCHSNSKLHS